MLDSLHVNTIVHLWVGRTRVSLFTMARTAAVWLIRVVLASFWSGKTELVNKSAYQRVPPTPPPPETVQKQFGPKYFSRSAPIIFLKHWQSPISSVRHACPVFQNDKGVQPQDTYQYPPFSWSTGSPPCLKWGCPVFQRDKSRITPHLTITHHLLELPEFSQLSSQAHMPSHFQNDKSTTTGYFSVLTIFFKYW